MILLTVAATTLAALLYLAVADKVYEAEADLLVTPTTDENQALTGLGLIRESNDPTRDVETAARLVLSRDVAERVRSQLRLDEDASDLARRGGRGARGAEQLRDHHRQRRHPGKGARPGQRLRRGCRGRPHGGPRAAAGRPPPAPARASAGRRGCGRQRAGQPAGAAGSAGGASRRRRSHPAHRDPRRGAQLSRGPAPGAHPGRGRHGRPDPGHRRRIRPSRPGPGAAARGAAAGALQPSDPRSHPEGAQGPHVLPRQAHVLRPRAAFQAPPRARAESALAHHQRGVPDAADDARWRVAAGPRAVAARSW